MPSPKDLLGKLASDSVGISFTGEEATLMELSKPMLLAFFGLRRVPCWEAFPVLRELPREAAVVRVAGVGPRGLTFSSKGLITLSSFG